MALSKLFLYLGVPCFSPELRQPRLSRQSADTKKIGREIFVTKNASGGVCRPPKPYDWRSAVLTKRLGRFKMSTELFRTLITAIRPKYFWWNCIFKRTPSKVSSVDFLICFIFLARHKFKNYTSSMSNHSHSRL